jgi:putative ABC transport system ATP-binding protein
MVKLENIWKTYSLGKVNVDALKGVNLELAAGDFVSVAGPSGSGKTTMMNIIGLIDKPTLGKVFINGKETGTLNRRDLTRMRHDMLGFVFQSFNLLPVLNVFENVELPLALGKKNIPKAERRDRVEYLLEEVGLSDRRNHKPAELSGGQQQRVAIARALSNRPRIVIADEPTANLDTANGERILELMKKINREEGTTFIFSTHNPDIWAIADHIIFIRDGAVESEKRQARMKNKTEAAGDMA